MFLGWNYPTPPKKNWQNGDAQFSVDISIKKIIPLHFWKGDGGSGLFLSKIPNIEIEMCTTKWVLFHPFCDVYHQLCCCCLTILTTYDGWYIMGYAPEPSHSYRWLRNRSCTLNFKILHSYPGHSTSGTTSWYQTHTHLLAPVLSSYPVHRSYLCRWAPCTAMVSWIRWIY